MVVHVVDRAFDVARHDASFQTAESVGVSIVLTEQQAGDDELLVHSGQEWIAAKGGIVEIGDQEADVSAEPTALGAGEIDDRREFRRPDRRVAEQSRQLSHHRRLGYRDGHPLASAFRMGQVSQGRRNDRMAGAAYGAACLVEDFGSAAKVKVDEIIIAFALSGSAYPDL